MRRPLGVSLCKQHRKQPEGDGFAEGQAYLEQATRLDPADVDAWASLGGTWRTRQNASASPEDQAAYRQKARACYRRAFEIEPDNPYPLGNYIEYEIAEHPELDIASYFRPSLERANRRCHLQAEVGINMPWSYFDLGKFQLLLRNSYVALSHYAQGIASSPAAFFVESALASFTTLEATREHLPGFDWSRNLLSLALAIRFGRRETDLHALSKRPALHGPVVILAGYADRLAAPDHHALLIDVLKDFCGAFDIYERVVLVIKKWFPYFDGKLLPLSQQENHEHVVPGNRPARTSNHDFTPR